jgi:hypothetical protein
MKFCVNVNLFKANKMPLFLAYIPKMKAGLSNHQSVCLCVPH